MNDVLQELYDEFPEIEEKSIEKICKSGLAGIRKVVRAKEELLIKLGEGKEMKFYIPCSPEVQDKITDNNRRKRLYAKLRKENGKASE